MFSPVTKSFDLRKTPFSSGSERIVMRSSPFGPCGGGSGHLVPDRAQVLVLLDRLQPRVVAGTGGIAAPTCRPRSSKLMLTGWRIIGSLATQRGREALGQLHPLDGFLGRVALVLSGGDRGEDEEKRQQQAKRGIVRTPGSGWQTVQNCRMFRRREKCKHRTCNQSGVKGVRGYSSAIQGQISKSGSHTGSVKTAHVSWATLLQLSRALLDRFSHGLISVSGVTAPDITPSKGNRNLFVTCDREDYFAFALETDF